MRILHMSDIHLTKYGCTIWETDTMKHFTSALDKIRSLKDIDAIIVSGDISDDGSLWTYEYADNCFKELGIPTFFCPGNHDSLPVFYNSFKPRFAKICTQAFIGDWNFVFLNTVIPEEEGFSNKARGFVKEHDFSLLYKNLNCMHPTCIVFHHPPLEPGGWLNRKLLDNRDDFNLFIQRYPNVKLVLFGHIHYHIIQKHNGIIYSAAPSIGFGFDKDLPKYQIADGTEGFNLIRIDKNNISIDKMLI